MPSDLHKKNGIKRIVEAVTKTEKKINKVVDQRMQEFDNNKNWFSELCFCLLTANYTAEGGITIQNEIDDFCKYDEKQIEKILRKFGHRFPPQRARRIFLARKHKKKLEGLCSMKNSMERREWLVENVEGLGYKEASHFLRNVGYLDVAIVDRHILRILDDYSIIKMPKTLTKKRYLEIEDKLKEIASKCKMSLGELDLYLWYMKTGKVLK